MKTLDDFLQMDVIRHAGLAQIVVGYEQQHPITIDNFDADLSDFEIAEEAFSFYCELRAATK